MTTSVRPIELKPGEAISWLRSSLAQGFQISEAIAATTPFENGQIRVIAPVEATALPPLNQGGLLSQEEANDAMSGVLAELTASGAACLVIEDALGRYGDPAVLASTLGTAWLDNRVLHWHPLDLSTTSSATNALRTGSSGYPLNAFVTTRTADALGLIDHTALEESGIDKICEALIAVIVSAFDAESFLIWTKH
jgi:hypothetical protein